MDHSDAGAQAPFSFTCDGTSVYRTARGRPDLFTGHVLAGVLFIVWAAHWALGLFLSYLGSNKSSPYTASGSYGVLGLSSKLATKLEAALKVVLPAGYIVYEGFIRTKGPLPAVCPAESSFPGHFIVAHIHTFQNIWIAGWFLLSGLVELLQGLLELPEAAHQAVLVGAFGFQALLLNNSYYLEDLDSNVYFLLFLTSTAVAFFLAAEIAFQHSFPLSCGKVLALMMHGIWYCAAARVLYQGLPAWQTYPQPDMAPVMFLPIIFTFWINASSAGLLTLFLGVRAVVGEQQVHSSASHMVHAGNGNGHMHTHGNGHAHGNGYGYSSSSPRKHVALAHD